MRIPTFISLFFLLVWNSCGTSPNTDTALATESPICGLWQLAVPTNIAPQYHLSEAEILMARPMRMKVDFTENGDSLEIVMAPDLSNDEKTIVRLHLQKELNEAAIVLRDAGMSDEEIEEFVSNGLKVLDGEPITSLMEFMSEDKSSIRIKDNKGTGQLIFANDTLTMGDGEELIKFVRVE